MIIIFKKMEDHYKELGWLTQKILTLTINGEDMLSKASSILFAVWLVTLLLPTPLFTMKQVWF